MRLVKCAVKSSHTSATECATVLHTVRGRRTHGTVKLTAPKHVNVTAWNAPLQQESVSPTSARLKEVCPATSAIHDQLLVPTDETPPHQGRYPTVLPHQAIVSEKLLGPPTLQRESLLENDIEECWSRATSRIANQPF